MEENAHSLDCFWCECRRQFWNFKAITISMFLNLFVRQVLMLTLCYYQLTLLFIDIQDRRLDHKLIGYWVWTIKWNDISHVLQKKIISGNIWLAVITSHVTRGHTSRMLLLSQIKYCLLALYCSISLPNDPLPKKKVSYVTNILDISIKPTPLCSTLSPPSYMTISVSHTPLLVELAYFGYVIYFTVDPYCWQCASAVK